MTVPATGSRWTYAGNAVTTAFSVNRKFIDETDLTVYLVDDTTGVGTAQVYGADYIVTGAGDPAGGTVTFTAAPDAGETVLIYRDTDRTQNASLDNVTALPMAALESSLDWAQLGIDELRTIVGRSARLDDSDPTDSLNAISKKAIRKSKVLGFDANGNFSYYERGQIADEYVSLVQNLRYYNPCDATWGATGDGVTDDLAIVQDCVNDLIADGGGILLINHKHALSGTLTIPAGAPVTIYSPAPYLGQFICTHGNDAVVIERTLVGTDAAPRVENLGIIKGSGASTGGIALKIAYDDINSGSYKGAVVRGCYFTRNGATYFNTGIDLTRCTHATIEECFIQGQGGTSSTKVGSGVNLNTWCQGLTVHNNKIRGFLNGLLISDISVDVSEDFQSEGYSIRGNSVTNCTNGLVSSITSTEVSWVVQANSFDCTKTGLSLDNLIRVQIEENRFGWNGGHTDHADIVLRRTDGVSPTTSTMQNLVGKNRAFRKGDLELAVSGVTRGATTTITYTTVSKTRSITAISQGNPCVITYSGGDAFSDDDTVSLSGILGMTELNGYSGRIQNVNTGANTFELAGVDSTGFTAYVSGGSAALVSATGTLANDDVLYLYGIGGTTQLNGRPVKVASLNTGAGTFVAKDYETGADIASTAYGAYTSGGSIVRYGRFLEIKGGADIDALGNQITFRSVGLHLWANAKNVSWAQNRLVGKDGSSVIEAINNSSYQGTLTILPMGAAEYLVRDGGAPGDGVKDDTAFLQAVLTAGNPLICDPRKTYRVSSRLTIPANGKVIGNGATFIMDLGGFTNSDRTSYYSSTGALFYASGVSSVQICDVKVVPSVQSGGRIRIPITNVTKSGGANVKVYYSDANIFADGQKVTLYNITGADEVDSDTLAGAANATEYTITALSAAAGTFELSGTSAVVLTAYVSGGYIEPKRFPGVISLRNCDDVKIRDVEISGFTAGYGIALDSCGRVDIECPHIHDFYSSYCFDTASQAQATGIVIDGSRVSGEGSGMVTIRDGKIYNLTKAGAGQYSQDSPTAKRVQTDAINIAGPDADGLGGSSPSAGVIVSGMFIDNVDEGIDCFGTKVTITGNQITNLISYAVKCIYCPRDMIISGNLLGPSRRDNVTISTNTTSGSDEPTRRIIIANNNFRGVDSNEYGANNSCLHIFDSGPLTTQQTVTDVIATGNIYDPNTYGEYCIDYGVQNYDGSFFSNGDHFVQKGTAGWIARPYYRKIGIASISKTNPAVVTLIPNADPALLQWIANSGQTIYIKNALGMTQIADGYYKMNSNRVGDAFDLGNSSGVAIDSTGYSTYTGGGSVQVGSKIQVANPHNKTIAKLAPIAAQSFGAGVLTGTIEFKAPVYDSRDEIDAANNGLKIQLPGFYRVDTEVRTTAGTPSGATEETVLSIAVTGLGNVIQKSFTPRDTEPFTYAASGIVWCDRDDIITVKLTFVANAAGVTFSNSHRLTFLSVEMI